MCVHICVCTAGGKLLLFREKNRSKEDWTSIIFYSLARVTFSTDLYNMSGHPRRMAREQVMSVWVRNAACFQEIYISEWWNTV